MLVTDLAEKNLFSVSPLRGGIETKTRHNRISKPPPSFLSSVTSSIKPKHGSVGHSDSKDLSGGELFK